MFNKLVLFIILALFSGSSMAQTNQFSLQQSVEYAIEHNRSLKNAKIDAEIAKRQVWETVAIGLPQLNANSQLQDFLDIPTVLIPASAFGGPPGVYNAARFGTKYTFSYGVDASMILFDGSYLAGLQASNTYKQAAAQLANKSEVDVRVAVTKAYYTVLVSGESIKLLDATVIRLKKTMEDTKAFYENGFAEKVDYDRLQVVYNNLLVEQNRYTQLLGVQILNLKFQMGMPLTEELVLTDKLDQIPFKPILEKVDKVDFTLRPDYNAVVSLQKLNELKLRSAKLSYLPSLVAFGTFSKNSPKDKFVDLFSNPQFPTSIIGLKATMPIFGGFKKYQQYKQAKLNVMKSANDLESLEAGMTMEAQAAQINYNSNVMALENQTKNRELAKEVLRVAKAKYEQGVGSSLELVSAETDLKEAETNYIEALYNALAARVDFDKAQGYIK